MLSPIDFILNLAGLLLWFSWRAVGFDPFTRATPATLAGTLRRAEPSRMHRWQFLAALGVLLLLRAVFYWQIGPAINWVPRLNLFFVALAFRGDVFGVILLYSVLSFLRALVVFHFWLLFLALVNRRGVTAGPYQKMIQLQLGRPAGWPWWLLLILPVVLIAAGWIVLQPALIHAGVVTRAHSTVHLVEQGFLIGAGVLFSLKYLLPAFLLLHLITSYVYLGNNPLWDFIGATSRNILAPLRRLPLRIGRMDFAPLAGIAIILLLLHFLPERVRTEMILRKLPVWPQ